MNETTETGIAIPAEFQKMTITKAHELMGISRTTFYRNFLDNGKITISSDEQGRKFIAFSELYRVFGEEAIQKILGQQQDIPKNGIGESGTQPEHEWDNGKILGTPSGHVSMLVENARLLERVEALQERLKDREERLREKDLLISRQDRRIEALEGQVTNLLEDKSQKDISKTPLWEHHQESIAQINHKLKALEEKSQHDASPIAAFFTKIFKKI